MGEQFKDNGGRVIIKSEAKGEVEVVFATLNVMDSDRDVTLPGAFSEGESVALSAYGHRVWDGAPPVGRGTIHEVGDEAIFRGQFFMDTTAGRETFLTVKGMGEIQQWSYGFTTELAEYGEFQGQDVKFLKKLRVFEVSPVLRAAGVGTRTTSAKGYKGEGGPAVTVPELIAIKGHDSRIVTDPWRGCDLGSAPTIEQLRAVSAAWNPAGDPGDLKSYGFVHHTRPDGPANVRELLKSIAQLNGAKGGPVLTGTQRDSVYDHLAGHLSDAGLDAPALLEIGADTSKLKFADHMDFVMVEIGILRKRAAEVMATRATKGKALGGMSIDRLEWIGDEMRELKSLIDSPRDTATLEYLRFLRDSLPAIEAETEDAGKGE